MPEGPPPQGDTMLYADQTRELMSERMREAERERLVRAMRLQRRAERVTQRARRALNVLAA
ncbi:hypothetical protein AB0C59_00660 [Streptomyces sp. NPDC048664]|uniref:hypothetical protein n=1 Tax=Streptomyces sp. NPDC048664 TaxID=3154505 RepID=UPI003430C371